MPGITGIISDKPREQNERDLHLMIECLMHEPFYSSGTYVNEKLNLYAGWVCHMGSFSDCMPIFNEEKDLILIFSGENFADKDLIHQLTMQGHKFDASNSSYLIHLYEEKNERFLKYLNGWFSGILINLRNGKVVLFNDRYGMSRIYYHKGESEFIFSSEVKSLLKIRSYLRIIDSKGFGEFFSCGSVLENRSLFTKIDLLPAGSEWTFDKDSNIKKKVYFNPIDWENKTSLDEEQFYIKFKATFKDILPRYFASNGRIGLSLTGGLDSRMIMAYTDKLPGELPCHTFTSMYRNSYDVKIANKIANLCNQNHHSLHLAEEFLSDFPTYAEKAIYISDGCLSACESYELYLNKLARDIAPIRITGDFGSEIFKKHTTFKAVSRSPKLFDYDFYRYIQQAKSTLSDLSKGNKISFAVFKEAPWNMYGMLVIQQSQLTVRSPYLDNDLVELVYQAPEGFTLSDDFSLRFIADGNPELIKIITDRGVGGNSSYLFSKLVKLYYEFLFKADYRLNHGMPHWLVKIYSVIAPLYPERFFLGRYKFYHYRTWFRNDLSDYVKDVLLDNRTANRPYLNKRFINKMVFEHIKGISNYTYEINRLISAELIQRLFVD